MGSSASESKSLLHNTILLYWFKNKPALITQLEKSNYNQVGLIQVDKMISLLSWLNT